MKEPKVFSVQEIKEEADKAARVIKDELVKLFPDFYVRVNRNSIGEDTVIGVHFATVPMDSRHLDVLNAPKIVRLMCHLTTRFGKKEPMSKFSMELVTKSNRDIKYRKITTKSLEDLATKTVAWFTKNKDFYKS